MLVSSFSDVHENVHIGEYKKVIFEIDLINRIY